MKKVNPFLKSSAAYMVGTAIGQGASLIAMIVFTRIMSTADYGRYSTYYACMALIVPFVGANLYFAINNAYIDYKKEIVAFRKSILFLSTLIMLAILGVLGIIKLIFIPNVPFWIVAAAVLHAYSFFVVNYRKYSANMENDGKTKTILLIFPETLQFIFPLAMLLILTANAYYVRVIGSMAGVLLCAVIVYINIIKADGKLIVPEYWKYALAISVPSIIVSMSSLLMQQCDKVIITGFCGEEETVVYSVVYYIGYAILIINQAIGPVRQMWVYNCLGESDTTQFKSVQKWYLFIVAGVEIAIYMIAPEVIRLVFPSDYWRYSYIAPFMLSACILVAGEFYSEVVMFHKKNTELSVCVVISAVINIGLNFLLVPIFGAVVAAYTTVVGYLVALLLYRRLANKYSKRVYSDRICAGFILFSVIVAGVFISVMNLIIARYLLFGILLVIWGLFALIKRNEWMPFILKRERK